MRMKQVAELVKVNMIYANPQMIEKKRNKQAEKGTVSKVPAYMSVVWQNVLLVAIFLWMFSFMFSSIDLIQYPGMFTTFAATFILMALLQGFYMVYNLFYDSKDLVYYLPLPFKANEVFIAKLAVLAFMLLPYLFSVWVLFLFLGLDAGHTLFLLIPGSLLLFLVVMAIVFAFSLVLVHLMTKLPLFEKHKQVVTTTLYAISSLGMVAAIFFLTNRSTAAMDPETGVIPDMPVIPFIGAFYRILITPFNLEAWLGLIGWLLFLAALSFIVFKWVVPGFYQIEQTSSTNKKKPVKTTAPTKKAAVAQRPTTVNKTLFKYNLGLLQDGTLIMQFLSSKLMMPLILLGPTVLEGANLADIPLLLWPIFFFAGFVYTFLSLNAISIVGVIISLDRENFLYMKALPFSMKHYLRFKYLFAFGVELILPLVLAIVAATLLQVPFVLGLFFLVGLIVGTLGLSHYYFVRDFRKLDLDWQNLTELFNRGGGTWLQVISIFVSVFVGILAVVFATMGLLFLPSIGQIALSIVLLLVPLGFTISLLVYYKKNFWPTLEG